LRIPIAHGEGNFTADAATLRALNAEGRVLVRYCDEVAGATPEANPNGTVENIAGICNAKRNIFGLMPHPERACDPALLSTDGRVIFESLIATLTKTKAA
jgi:phosphoribosylformylglycinamidine synthase